eukprot:gb/GECH01010825.1/.p1 GENE.gb/GECH01010825.1/~~gb/GECH01010825.1/.p1  ORF type:complete len:449 (+),score=79.89 gb/GECH01010825.1/:1-1347(+)
MQFSKFQYRRSDVLSSIREPAMAIRPEKTNVPSNTLRQTLKTLSCNNGNLEALSGKTPEQISEIEVLYMRNNFLVYLPFDQKMSYLTLLDMSCNQLESLEALQNTPNLVYGFFSFNKIEKFEHVNLKNLNVLTLSSNQIDSWNAFPTTYDLQNLQMASNNISTFENFPKLDNLEQINLKDNPITSKEFYKLSALALLPKLRKLDGQEITKHDREEVNELPHNLPQALREGFNFSSKEDLKAAVNEFFCSKQKHSDQILELLDISIEGKCVEETTLTAFPMFKKVNHDLKIYPNELCEHQLYVESEAECLSIFFKHLYKGVQFDKIDEKNHYLSLLLPPGEYEYKIIEGNGDHNNKPLSNYENLTVHHNPHSPLTDTELKEYDYSVDFYWGRGKNMAQKSIIQDRQSLLYKTCKDDVNRHIFFYATVSKCCSLPSPKNYSSFTDKIQFR